MHSSRVTLPILIAFLTGPAPASAQVEIHVVPNDKFVTQLGGAEPSLLRFLTEGTLAQGRDSDLPRCSAVRGAEGIRLGAELSEAQLLRVPPLARMGKAALKDHGTARQSVNASELLERPEGVFAL